MTFYNFNKNPLSPELMKMIAPIYSDKLIKLCDYSFKKLLSSLGFFKLLQSQHDDWAEITGVISHVYDSYNKNPFFQWVVCYHLDSLGLLYDKPCIFIPSSCQIEGCKFRHEKIYCSRSPFVKTPDGFISLSHSSCKKRHGLQLCQIDNSLKFGPEFLKMITVEEVEELKRKAFLKQEDRHFYLHSERNRTIKAINERYDLTPQQKKLRVGRIEEKYQRNLTKYMGQVVSITHWAERNLRNKESDITQNKTLLLDLTTNLIELKVDERTAENEQQKQFVTQKRIELELKQKQAEQSVIDSKVRLEELKVYYQAICAEATAVEQQLWTPELQDRYFAGIQVRKDAKNL